MSEQITVEIFEHLVGLAALRLDPTRRSTCASS